MTYLHRSKIPKSHEVQPLKPGQKAKDKATCGECGLSWDDGKVTSMTPAPSAHCPFEAFHVYDDDEEHDEDTMIQTPYGKKRWSFLKRMLDSHDELVEYAKWVCKLFPATSPRAQSVLRGYVTKLNAVVNKASDE